jgi:hypothetical protein
MWHTDQCKVTFCLQQLKKFCLFAVKQKFSNSAKRLAQITVSSKLNFKTDVTIPHIQEEVYSMGNIIHPQ